MNKKKIKLAAGLAQLQFGFEIMRHDLTDEETAEVFALTAGHLIQHADSDDGGSLSDAGKFILGALETHPRATVFRESQQSQ